MMRKLFPTCFLLLIFAHCGGCAKLSSSSMNSAAVQEQLFQENATVGESQVAPVVRAQSAILTLPPAMRLTTIGSTTCETSEARSSRSEARHQRALKFAQAQKDVVAKYKMQKQASLNSNVASPSQENQPSATGIKPDSDPSLNTFNVSTTAADSLQVPLAASSWNLIGPSSWLSIGHRSPVFITMLVIALGGLTWPLARGPRQAVNEWMHDQGRRTLEPVLPVLSNLNSGTQPVSVSPVPVPPAEPQAKVDQQSSGQQRHQISVSQTLQMFAQIDASELPLETTMCMAIWESHAAGVIADNIDTSQLANGDEIASEIRLREEASSAPQSTPSTPNYVIAKLPHRKAPSAQTIRLSPRAERFLKAGTLALPNYSKVNAIATVRHDPSSGLIRVDQSSRLPARAAHHRSISLNHRDVGLPRSVVGVVVLFPQGENGEPARQVMMVESYELDEHSQLTATVVRVA